MQFRTAGHSCKLGRSIGLRDEVGVAGRRIDRAEQRHPRVHRTPLVGLVVSACQDLRVDCHRSLDHFGRALADELRDLQLHCGLDERVARCHQAGPRRLNELWQSHLDRCRHDALLHTCHELWHLVTHLLNP